MQGQITGTEVTEVRFEGNEAFDDEQLRRLILTRGAECRNVILTAFCLLRADFSLEPFLLSPLALPSRRRASAFLLCRPGIPVRPGRHGDGLCTSDSSQVQVTFEVTEDEPVRVEQIDVSGVDELGPELLRGLTTRVGTPLDQVALRADQDTVRFRLQNRGYAHAEVLKGFVHSPRTDPYHAEVTLDVLPGPLARIGPISVEGNERLDDAVILRMLPFSEGSVYAREDIATAQRNLYSLELVRSATVAADVSNPLGYDHSL